MGDRLARIMRHPTARATSRPIGHAIAFQRAPRAEERAAGESLVARHGAAAFSRAILNANELIHVD